MNYESDSLTPEYNFGFGYNFGGGAPPSGGVTAQVASTNACPGCAANRFISNLGLPMILIALAVIVLAFRK